MKTVPFKSSKEVSLGVELEFQIIDPLTGDLIARAKDLLRNIQESPYSEQIKPEITQGMIEINSSVHSSTKELHEELFKMRNYLMLEGNKLNVNFSGGGTHPFRKWSLNKIFPTKRFKRLSRQYRYLSQCSTVFGQHVHIGCVNAEDAIYLTHALIRFVPHVIALSASSPFYQGVDTSYNSSRVTIFTAFPTSGVMPFFLNWSDFSAYFYKLRKLGIIQTMKDFYWDIRPKPEFGTVEVRVCDTPLTISKAVMITAYLQSLALYLIKEKPIKLTQDLYYLYAYNRFHASRYGYDGIIIDPFTQQKVSIADDIRNTLKNIEPYANKLGNMGYLMQLTDDLINKENDALLIRNIYKKTESLPKLVNEQCYLWKYDR